jgi:DNA-binding NarL/FixJ family response regulator
MNAVATRAQPVRVVIIDDTEDIRILLRLSLSKGGMDVVAEAADGREGIEVVRRERPDVVLLDLGMPVLDGRRALPLIRQLMPDGRIIVLSAYGADLMSEEVLGMGADGYVQKGFSMRRIVQFVEDAVAVPGPLTKPGPVLSLVPGSS